MSRTKISDEELEKVIQKMAPSFTILDYVDVMRKMFPKLWENLVKRYGLYGNGSGTRYSAMTYLSNRLSSYSKRKRPNLLEPMPVGWSPKESRYLRKTKPDERKGFGSPWIVVYRKRESR